MKIHRFKISWLYANLQLSTSTYQQSFSWGVSSTLCCECLDIIVCDGKLKVNIEIGRMFEW